MMAVQTLGEDMAVMVPIVGIVFGCLGWFISIVMGAIRDSNRTKQREESRREIAAYIAEGSMTAEQGERLMAAGEDPKDKKSCS